MNLFSWLTARRDTTKLRTTLSVNELEARDVPAAAVPTLDLGTVGATGSINGAIFSQYNPNAPANIHNGPVQSFLRLNEEGRERGYNTDARHLQFDEIRNGTHSIRVDDLPLVTRGGVQYRELVLDVNEPSRQSKISLDELRVYVSNDPKLHGYNNRTHTLGGVHPSYDLGTNRWVRIDAGLNHQVGTGDVLVDIPASELTGGTYLALYSRFGVHNGSGGAYEQWGPGFKAATQTSTISGIAFFDYDNNGKYDVGLDSPAGFYSVSLYVNGVAVQTVTTDANGTYTFTVSLDRAVTYTVQSTDIYSTITPATGTLNPGDNLLNVDLALRPLG